MFLFSCRFLCLLKSIFVAGSLLRLFRPVVQVVAHCVLDMAEAVSAQVFAAIPACDHDNVVMQALSLQHLDDQHAGPGFAVVVLYRHAVLQERPGVVGRFQKLLLAAKLLDKRLGLIGRVALSAGDRVLGASV